MDGGSLERETRQMLNEVVTSGKLLSAALAQTRAMVSDRTALLRAMKVEKSDSMTSGRESSARSRSRNSAMTHNA